MDEEGDDMTNIVLTPEMVAVQFDTLSTIPSHQSNSDEKQLQRYLLLFYIFLHCFVACIV